MFTKTLYRLVARSETLPALKERYAHLSTLGRETALAALAQAYDSAELAAFCCPLLWAEKASNSASSELVRETIALPLRGVAPGEVLEMDQNWEECDDELRWEQMRQHLLTHGGYLLSTPSAHVPEQRMVLINMAHKAFTNAVIQTRRLRNPEDDRSAASAIQTYAESLEPH
jgi:hypothetical protein